MREIDQVKASLETTSAAIEEEAQKIVETSSLLNDNLVGAVKGIWRQLLVIWAVMIALLIAYVSVLQKTPADRDSLPSGQPASPAVASLPQEIGPNPPPGSVTDPSEECFKLLHQIREAQLRKDIDLFLSAYSPHFPDMEKKKERTLKIWKTYDFREMQFHMDDLHQKDPLTYLGKVTWNVKFKNVDTQEISTSLKSYQVSFSQESGKWLIQSLEPIEDKK